MMDSTLETMKTGTSTVGICFKDGVIVGADHRATMGHFIANKNVQKLFSISNKVALTTAGLVGDAQVLARVLAAEIALFEMKRNCEMSVEAAYWVQLLIAGVDADGGHVYSIDSAGGSIPDTYCATGSGSPYMYGVLEDQYKDDMTRNEALKVTARALLASSQRDSASGNGMDLAVITMKDGFKLLTLAEKEALLKSI